MWLVRLVMCATGCTALGLESVDRNFDVGHAPGLDEIQVVAGQAGAEVSKLKYL